MFPRFIFIQTFLFFKPFHDNDLFLYPLKTSENLSFSNVSGGGGGTEKDKRHEMGYQSFVAFIMKA